MSAPKRTFLLCVVVAIAHCGIVDFANMIEKVVQRSPFSYVLYGCHCGLGGRGRPLDDIDWYCKATGLDLVTGRGVECTKEVGWDVTPPTANYEASNSGSRCCHVHDCCFGFMEKLGCNPMYQRYEFSYVDGNLTCDSQYNNDCARQICECDRVAALCFKKHNSKFSRWTAMSSRMFCRGLVPRC